MGKGFIKPVHTFFNEFVMFLQIVANVSFVLVLWQYNVLKDEIIYAEKR